jgi:hypothetical protein
MDKNAGDELKLVSQEDDLKKNLAQIKRSLNLDRFFAVISSLLALFAVYNIVRDVHKHQTFSPSDIPQDVMRDFNAQALLAQVGPQFEREAPQFWQEFTTGLGDGTMPISESEELTINFNRAEAKAFVDSKVAQEILDTKKKTREGIYTNTYFAVLTAAFGLAMIYGLKKGKLKVTEIQREIEALQKKETPPLVLRTFDAD